MNPITIQVGDSPKLYYSFRDIYGNMLSLAGSDFITLSWSVYKLSSGTKIPVEGFTDIAIPLSNWHSEALDFPASISGVSGSAKEEGYNLEVFPYIAQSDEDTTVWGSPFNEAGTSYYLEVSLSYMMSDTALTGNALHTRKHTIRIVTETV